MIIIIKASRCSKVSTMHVPDLMISQVHMCDYYLKSQGQSSMKAVSNTKFVKFS